MTFWEFISITSEEHPVLFGIIVITFLVMFYGLVVRPLLSLGDISDELEIIGNKLDTLNEKLEKLGNE